MKTVIFDLDGTLTDTLQDLHSSVNHALKSCGYPLRSINEVRRFVGNGVHKLIERAVPEGTGTEDTERCFGIFRDYYVVHCQDTTRLYPGIAEMLDELKARGVKMAIVSNKLQQGVDELYKRWFEETVEVAIGEREGIRRKPYPDMVHIAIDRLGVSREDCVYVGDSDVDVQTAQNAGLPCISVLWGFRDKEELEMCGATTFVERPEEIVQYLSLSE